MGRLPVLRGDALDAAMAVLRSRGESRVTWQEVQLVFWELDLRGAGSCPRAFQDALRSHGWPNPARGYWATQKP